MTVLVGCTIAAFKALDRPRMESEAWLTHSRAWADAGVRFAATLQVGQGHDHALAPLEQRLEDLGGQVWRFMVDDGLPKVTGRSRLKAICTGRNLLHEMVNDDPSISHLLFLDSDVQPPPDVIERLTEVHHPIVAGHCPTYCLDGPPVQALEQEDGKWLVLDPNDPQHGTHFSKRPFPAGADVRSHWSSAGCWMLTRHAVNRLRWGWNLDEGQTDDPWTASQALRAGLGPVWTRHDCVVRHHPESIVPLEGRGHELTVLR